MVLLWLFFILFFVLIELGHPGLFYFLSLSCGALIGLLCDYLNYDLPTQILSFVVGSFIMWFFLAIVVSLSEKQKQYRSNVYALQGMRGVALTQIDPLNAGTVKISGQVWSALSFEEEHIIKEGSVVEVINVKGVHLIVVLSRRA